MAQSRNKVLVILGPTASGKSELGVRLAKKFGGEIISADSRQVYKGLDVGTGKITRQEMKGVPHHLLDVANPKKQFTVADYKSLALEALRKITQPVVVGGTGFYIDALAGTINFPDVPSNKVLRNKLNKLSQEKLFKMLEKLDARRAKSIDPHNKVRLIRALEIIEKIGAVPKSRILNPKSEFIFIGLLPDDLDKRIRVRLEKRLDGMIREGQKLYRKGLSYKRMHELGLEYRYIAMYLQGKLNKLDMLNKLYKEIRRYSKRQMTWFKRNKKIKWFKPEEYKEIVAHLRERLCEN